MAVQERPPTGNKTVVKHTAPPRPASTNRNGSVSVGSTSSKEGSALGPLRFHIQKPEDKSQYPHLHVTMQGLMDNYLQALSQDIPLHHTHINRKARIKQSQSRKMKYSSKTSSPLKSLSVKTKDEKDGKSEIESKSREREFSQISHSSSSSSSLHPTEKLTQGSQTSPEVSDSERHNGDKDTSSDESDDYISETDEDKDEENAAKLKTKNNSTQVSSKVWDIETASKAADELLSTEKTYVRGLKMLSNTFIKGLTVFREMEQEIITEEHQKQMFQNITDIFALHHKLYGDLKALRANGPGIGDLLVKLGATLLSYTPFFRMYTTYVNNYEKALDKLKECRERLESFEFYIQYTERVLNIHTQGIESLLITPVQRIPRYILLLKEIVKCLEKNDYSKSTDKRNLETIQNIQKALSEISKLAVDINESFRLREAREALLGIDQRLKGLDGHILPCDTPVSAKKNGSVSLVTPHRYFVKAGFLKKKHKNRLQNFNAWDERYFILLNDLLLYVRTSSKANDTSPLYLKGVYSLADITVREVSDETKIGRHLNLPKGIERKATSSNVVSDMDPAEAECSFEIQTLDKKLRVKAESRQEKESWMTQIRSHAVATFTKLQNIIEAVAKVQAQHKNEMSMNSLTRTMSDPTMISHESESSELKQKPPVPKEVETHTHDRRKPSTSVRNTTLPRGFSIDVASESLPGSEAFRPRSPTSSLGIRPTRAISLDVPSDSSDIYRQPPRSPKSINIPPSVRNNSTKSHARGISVDVSNESVTTPQEISRPKSPKSMSTPPSPLPLPLPLPLPSRIQIDSSTTDITGRMRSQTSPRLPSTLMKYGTLPRTRGREPSEITSGTPGTSGTSGTSPPQGYATVRSHAGVGALDGQKKTSPIAYHFTARTT